MGSDHRPAPPQHVFEQFVRQLPTPVAIFDREVRYLAYSDAWLHAYRLPEQDLVGRCHYDVFPEIGAEWRKIHQHCLRGHTMTRDVDVFERADGSTDYLTWTVTCWREHGGAIGGLVMYTDVVTDRIRMEQKLREREELIRSLFEKSPVGLNLSRMDGLWVESNPAFLEMIGYSREEADGGLTYWDLTPREYDADERRQLESLERRGRYGPYEKEFVHKEGHRVPVRLNGFLVEREGEVYIWSLIEDITRRRSLERDVEQERLKSIQAAKLATLGEMAAGFAHEINNPLAIIDAYVGALRDQVAAEGHVDETLVDEAIAAMGDAVGRAAKIVGGLRKFAREDDGSDQQVVSVDSLVQEALDLCRSRIVNHGVRLDTTIRTGVCIRCSRIEFTQVLINLLNNAFDAVRHAPAQWIAIDASERGGRVAIRVLDSGPGIPAADAERVFNPFFTSKKAGEGTGLGLSISKGIIERLGGTLVCECSGPQPCFCIELPEARPS